LKRCEFDVRERETVEINTTYEGCSIMNSPSAQAMTADPSVVDAAVRFCDDVLASPTVELLKPRESYFRNKKGIIKSLTSGVDKTVTIPIANPTGAKVLSIVIHVPEYDVFHGSIVTAEGVCVARIHAQLSQRIFKPHTYELKEQLPVPIEWDSAPFGEVHVQTKDVTCCDVNHKYPDVLAQGPVDRIITWPSAIPPELRFLRPPHIVVVFRVSASSLVFFVLFTGVVVIRENFTSRTAPGRKSGASRGRQGR